MRRFVDLHTHSTASDGTWPPGAIVRAAEARRLAAVALTDHDTTDGLAEAAAAAREFPRLRFVPGIEVSAEPPSGTLHILGLGVDVGAESLQNLAAFLRAARDERNPKIVANLQRAGVRIDMDDVRAAAAASGSSGKVVGRMHIAEALIRAGIVKSLSEAFERHIGRGAPAYVERRRLSAADTIAAIREAGGVAALAHPVQLNCSNRAQLERIVRDLARAGLEAVEVYHSDHTPQQTRMYLDLAVRLKLEATGGSDFHGAAKPEVSIGRPRVSLAALGERLVERLMGEPEAV